MFRHPGIALAALLLPLLLGGCGKPAASVPDLSGIWTLDARGKAGAARNGVGDFEQTAPYTTEARDKRAAYHSLVDATGDSPGAYCVPGGMPISIFLGGGYPVEFVQRPEQLTIIYEAFHEVRRVFLDGRLIKPEDVLPSRGGISQGHFEGNTLVVVTTGLQESIDQATAHSENARIVERYTPRSEGGLRRLDFEVTIDDPQFYTQPPTLTREYTQLAEGRMLDYECTQADWEDHLEKLRGQLQKKK